MSLTVEYPNNIDVDNLTGDIISFLPAYNPIKFYVDSSNALACDHQYIADLYINGKYITRLKDRYQTFTRVNGSGTVIQTKYLGYFEVSRILRDYLTLNYNTGDDSLGTIGGTSAQQLGYVIDTMPKAIASFYLEFREIYNLNSDCSGAPTLSSVLFTTETLYAFDGAFDDGDNSLGYDSGFCLRGPQIHTISRYILQSSTLGYSTLTGTASPTQVKFLTNMPQNSKVKLDDNLKLLSVANYLHNGCFSTSSTIYNGLKIKTFPDNNSYTMRQFGAFGVSASSEVVINSINVSPMALNYWTSNNGFGFTGSNIPTGPIITANTTGYEVAVVKMHGMTASRHMTLPQKFIIDKKCNKYNKYKLIWKNRLGQADYFDFDLVSKRTVNITGRDTFTRNPYHNANIQRSGTQMSDTNYDTSRGETVLGVSANDVYTLNSNSLTQAESYWLEELFTSPDVFMEQKIIKRYKIEALRYIPVDLYTGKTGSIGIILEDKSITDLKTFEGLKLVSYRWDIVDQVTVPVFPYPLTNATLETDAFYINNGVANVWNYSVLDYNPDTGYFQTNYALNQPVIIETGTGWLTVTYRRFIPVITQTPNIEPRQTGNMKVFNYTIEVRPSFNKNIQQGT